MRGGLIENKCTATIGRLDKCTYTFDYPVASDIQIFHSGDYYVTVPKGTTTKTDYITDIDNPIISIVPSEDTVYIYT